MTDITKLAQREKFEAWWEREYKHLESSKYTDAVPHIKYGFWMAYQAGGAELVDALEKAQTERDEFRRRFNLERSILEDADKDLETLRQRIAELESHTVTVNMPRWLVKDAIAVYDRDDIEDALTAAGIKWEAE
ncbi:TPA: hypothetical protein QHC37_003942 [Klebsiella michiganensis]|nr:hypothetical protein [Klebsiella michiganensis]